MSLVASRGTATAVIGKISPPKFALQLASPVQDKLKGYVDANRSHTPLKVVEQNSHAGQKLAICGAGPSLAKQTIEAVDHIWACNSALPYLLDKGVKVSAGVGIDQTPGLLREWKDAPDVPYLLASSVEPELVQHLGAKGRDITFFHSAVGLEDELAYYTETWPGTIMVGQGFMVTSRMIGVAQWMGFERIDIYGCDCALDGDIAHANGEVVTEAYHNPLIMQADIDGRNWRTRPDMLIGAVDMVRRVRKGEGRIRLIGDTLPVALLGKSEEYLNDVCRVIKPGEPVTL
jgi:hypothetical protein